MVVDKNNVEAARDHRQNVGLHKLSQKIIKSALE